MLSKTRNPKIWLQYWCWCIQFWMNNHKPYYPDRLRFWLHTHYPDTQYTSRSQIEFWQKHLKDYQGSYRPWPWWVGSHYQGPLVEPWGKLASFFRRFTGGRSHRCEFTDKEMGALYGHNEGPFMDKLFEEFIKSISGLILSLFLLVSCAVTTQTDQAIAPDGTQIIHRQTTIIFDYSMPTGITKPKRFNTSEVMY